MAGSRCYHDTVEGSAFLPAVIAVTDARLHIVVAQPFQGGGCRLPEFRKVQPVPVNEDVLTFYLPLCLFTVVVVSFFMLRKRVSRWAGGVLLTLYLVFFVGGYIL
jgi:Ca2+/Na+ antiporter